MSDLVADKIVVITGAGSGIGRAGALIAADEGAAHVYVVDRDAAGGKSTVEQVNAVGGSATFLPADVTNEGDVAALIKTVVAEHGRVDCAWNNAGITDLSRPFHELDMAAWNQMISVNLTAVFVCMKHELMQMLAQGGGAIVNTSSGAGLVAAPGQPHYTAAKHGVLGLTKLAAQEYNGRGIRVNAVCPGMVDTPMLQGWFRSLGGLPKELMATLPGGKLGQPEQVARAAVWLCSDSADWVSGLSMVVDGGALNR